MQAQAFLVPQITTQLQTRLNPEGVASTGMITAAMALSGALQGGLIGAIFSETPWYNGLWKGAAAGAAASGVLGLLLAMAAGEDGIRYATGSGMSTCQSWSEIFKGALGLGVLSSINGLAAGAAVGDGHRGHTAGVAALWAAGAFAAINFAFGATDKVMPRRACA